MILHFPLLFMLDAVIKLLVNKQMARKGVFDVENDSPDCSSFLMFIWKACIRGCFLMSQDIMRLSLHFIRPLNDAFDAFDIANIACG